MVQEDRLFQAELIMRRNHAVSCALLLAAALLHAAPLTSAKDRRDKEQEEEVDHLALGARLFADGHVDRAEATLREVDTADKKTDRAKLFFLLGSIYLKKELYGQARDEFLKSIAAGQQNPAINIYLAQAHFQLKEYRQAIAALDKAPQAASENPGTFSMRAEAFWRLDDPQNALRALEQGSQRFPDFAKLFQMKVGFLIDLGLYQEVVRIGDKYLDRPAVQPEDFVAIAEALRRGKQLNEARLIMERAHLRFPEHVEAQLQLANIYNDLERPLTSAMLFERVAQRDGKYNFESAELYRESGRLSRALSLNARILDPQKKLKQRLSILIAMERFEQVAGMEASLSRSGLMKDDSIRYALAYGFFKNGDFESSERHLKLLNSAAVFEKATALRKAMATCREAGWACN
jgi:tetratricopeptide (TPR) repeat protein